MDEPHEPGGIAAFRTDRALKDRGEDRFSRWPFARRIAATLTRRDDPSCLVVGIYGSWGEGKTSVLNFIEEELSTDPQVVVVRFNPWLVSSDEALIASLFVTIAAGVDEKLSTAAERFGSALEAISIPLVIAQKLPILGSYVPGDAIRAWAEKLSQTGIEEKRRRIAAILRNARLRVVVIIDDIDRIEPHEVQLLFKIVRLAADFDNLTYLLAFDPAVVARALGIALGGTEALGRDFIEKIVEIPLNLPPARWSELRTMALEYVEVALKASEVVLNAALGSNLNYLFDAFAGRLRAPRHATAYGNALLFALPSLKGEADPVDLILMEGIRLFFPGLYDAMRVSPDIMLGHRSYENSSERQKALSAFLTAKVPDTSPEGLERLRRLLFYLFPAMFGAGLGPTGEQQRSRMQRISSELYFDRYFRYGVGDDDLADRELDTTLADVETSNDSEAGQSWERLLSDVPADVLIEKIRLRINELTAAGSARLALYLARAGSRFPFDGFSLWHSRSLFQNAATAIAALLLHITTPEGRREASAVVMQEVRPLPLGALVLEFLEKLSAAADGVSLTPAEGVDHCSAAAGMPRPV